MPGENSKRALSSPEASPNNMKPRPRVDSQEMTEFGASSSAGGAAGGGLETIEEHIVARNPENFADDLTDTGDRVRVESQQERIKRMVNNSIDGGQMVGDMAMELSSVKSSIATSRAAYENLNEELTSHQQVHYQFVESIDTWRQDYYQHVEETEEFKQTMFESMARKEELAQKDTEIQELRRMVETQNEQIAGLLANVGNIVGLTQKVNDLERIREEQDLKITQLEAIARSAETSANEAAAQAAQSLGRDPIEANNGEGFTNQEIAEIKKELQYQKDSYYINTISIKGYNEDRLVKDDAPRQQAAKILRMDGTEGLLDRASKVVFSDRSLRVTYPEAWMMKERLALIGSVANSLKKDEKELVLKYSQLTPPRFERDRLELVKRAKALKQNQEIMSFLFVLVKQKLMIKCNIKGATCSVLSLPDDFVHPEEGGAAAEDVEMQATDNAELHACIYCGEPMETSCVRMECGHGSHSQCLKLQCTLFQIKCGGCRHVPETISRNVLSGSMPGCEKCKTFTRNIPPEDVLKSLRLSPKCGHIHTLSCHSEYAPQWWADPDRKWSPARIDEAIASDWPGCYQCANPNVPRSINLFEVIKYFDDNTLTYVPLDAQVTQPTPGQGLQTVRRSVVFATPEPRGARDRARAGRSFTRQDGNRERRFQSSRPDDRRYGGGQQRQGGPRQNRSRSRNESRGRDRQNSRGRSNNRN